MEFKRRGFEPWSNQTNVFKIDACRFLARCLALLGEDKDKERTRRGPLAQCQDNVTEWDIRSRY